MRLDRVLLELGLVRSRSQAAEYIAAGRVRLEGAVTVKAGLKVAAGSDVEVEGADHYVGRAAHKLIAGLDAFGIDPSGALALDLGASTGGFTQVLIERGAREVMAIDVGHGQLAPVLRDDERVRVVEGCNARELNVERLARETGSPEIPSLVVADLSFISLTLVLPAIAATAPAATLLLLIKPQFEVGRQGIREGIVTDPTLAVSAVERVLAVAHGNGYACAGLAASPIAGEHGNSEFLAHFRQLPHPTDVFDPTEWRGRIRELVGLGGDS